MISDTLKGRIFCTTKLRTKSIIYPNSATKIGRIKIKHNSLICRSQYQVQRYDKSNARTSFGDLKSKLFLGLLFSSILIFRICLSSIVFERSPFGYVLSNEFVEQFNMGLVGRTIGFGKAPSQWI